MYSDTQRYNGGVYIYYTDTRSSFDGLFIINYYLV